MHALYLYTHDIIAVGSLILAAKVWFDISHILSENLRLHSYSKISSCALDIMRILQEESRKHAEKNVESE